MSTTMVMTVEEIAADRKKWLEKRMTGIGGSDASVIAGMNKWRSLFQLWMEKTGQLTDADKEEIAKRNADNEFIYWGIKLEALVAERFCELTGKKVRRCGMLRNNENPFMIADIDRLIVGENAILECKTTASWMAEEWADDNLPDAYYCQVQHYMAVGGYDKCYLACLMGGNKFIIKEIDRNEEDIAALMEAERIFWEKNVMAKELPTVDGTKGCTEALKRMFQGGGTEAAELSGEFDTLCDDILELKESAKAIEKAIDEKENKLRVAMGNAEYGRSPRYNVWYKSSSRSKFETEKFKTDCPELYEKYKSATAFRRLQIKKGKERSN